MIEEKKIMPFLFYFIFTIMDYILNKNEIFTVGKFTTSTTLFLY